LLITRCRTSEQNKCSFFASGERSVGRGTPLCKLHKRTNVRFRLLANHQLFGFREEQMFAERLGAPAAGEGRRVVHIAQRFEQMFVERLGAPAAGEGHGCTKVERTHRILN